MLRASLALYASDVLRGPPEYGGKFVLGPTHHVEWSEAIARNRRVLLLAARDHGKSHLACFAYPLWMMDRVAPGRLGYIFSATSRQAEEHLAKIRAELLGGGEHGEANPKLAHLLPLKKDTARTLILANNSEIRARGFGTRVRGGHPFWIVADDVLNDEHIWSELVRRKAVDYYLSAIEPMCVPGGQILVAATPFHAQDLYRHLEDSGVYTVLKHPALDAAGNALWPQRYPASVLAQKKQLVGSIRWSREYLVQPITDEASLFPSWLFDHPGVKLPYALGLPAEYWRAQGMDTFAGVDLAMSSSAAADYFVLFVLAIQASTGDRYVVDIIRRKGLGYQEQVDLIVNASKKYGCGLVFCEANQYQRVITDLVVRTSDTPIKAFYTKGRESKKASSVRRGMKEVYSANKNALDQGVPALRMLLENGKLKIPWDPSTREIVQSWIGEMQAFGWGEGKLQGVGAHDDTPMACWMADRAASVGGQFRFSFNENGSDGDDASDGNGEPDPDFYGDEDRGDEWRPREGVGLRLP